jgi:MscS family membrane protein
MEWLKNIVENNLTYHLLIAGAIIVASYLLSRPVRRLLKWIGGKIISRTDTVLDDRILEVLLTHVRPLMIVFGLHVALREIRKGATAADLTLHQVLEYADAILYVVVVVLVAKILLGVIKEIIDWYLDRVSTDGAPKLRKTLGPLTQKVVDLLVGLVGAIIVLDHFGVNIGSLLVSLGVGSLAVALAAQETLANMIAGFVILVDRPFRVGDRIELPSGHIGDVQEIGLRSTKLLNFDSNLLIIPNAELVRNRIINYAYPFNKMRVQLKILVARGVAIARVRAILIDLARKHPLIVKDSPPEVYFTAINDSSLELSLEARCEDYTKRYAAETSLREQMYEAFQMEGIEIPLPQRVVQMKATT